MEKTHDLIGGHIERAQALRDILKVGPDDQNGENRH